MSHYIATLNAYAERERARETAEAEAERTADVKGARERLTPLESRLGRLLETIPVEVQREGLSLPALQTTLKGRSRGRAHAGHVGSALRQLGWTRKRSWRGGDLGFAALWYPPGNA